MNKQPSAVNQGVRAAMDDTKRQQEASRNAAIVKTSIIGITANALLSAFKAMIGLASGSVAITMDAVNNLSDAASSIITIVGTKLATRPADKNHPFGYGRIEYLTAAVISLLVLYAGLTSLEESVKKIIHPETPNYTALALLIVAVAVAVKIFLGHYVKGMGQKVHSDSLINSGEDARLDSIISASTLLAALIFIFTGLSLEAWLGAAISLVIIKSGIDMLRDALSQILGQRAGSELARSIKRAAVSFEEVRGAYNLVINNYGPDTFLGSLHIEVADTMNANQIDTLIRAITDKVYAQTCVYLTAISVYSYNTTNEEVKNLRKVVDQIVHQHKNVLQMHGFYVDMVKKIMRFDLVVSFNEKDRDQLYRHVLNHVRQTFPDYTITANMDTDFSE